MTGPSRAPVRLLSYLAPSIPEGFFEVAASAIEDAIGRRVLFDYETSASVPTPATDPFASGRADLAFVCGLRTRFFSPRARRSRSFPRRRSSTIRATADVPCTFPTPYG